MMLATLIKELLPHGGVIAFGSFGHGFGRSRIKKEVKKYLEKAGIDVLDISTGDIFRRIAAEKGFSDINAFVKYLEDRPEEAAKIDTTVDKEVYEKIRAGVRSGKIVLIDSNLHAHPHALDNLPHIIFYIYAKPEVVGERLLKGRFGERVYSSPEEALKKQIERAKTDIERYRRLTKITKDPELSELYRKGAEVLEKMLTAFQIWDRLPSRTEQKKYLPHLTDRTFIIDNSGTVEETLEQIKEQLEKIVKESTT